MATNSIQRTGFGNHAFARYAGNIYDACALYQGTSNLQQYATASIDISSMPERQWSPDGTGIAFGISWIGNTNGVFEAAEVDNAVDSAIQMIRGVE